jgi:hypothetical protein
LQPTKLFPGTINIPITPGQIRQSSVTQNNRIPLHRGFTFRVDSDDIANCVRTRTTPPFVIIVLNFYFSPVASISENFILKNGS